MRTRRSALGISGVAGTMSLFLFAAWIANSAAFGQRGDRAPIDAAPPPAAWSIPPAPALSPDASIARMDVPAGFRVELVAAEPLVQDPIAVAFDPAGRLWVLEYPSYNWELRADLPGVEQGPAPRSRVVALDDTNADGRLDARTVFAEVDWPRGILPAAGGLLVLDLPDIVFLRDTDGDGRADSRDVVSSGLPIPATPHAAPSSLTWTIDNWIHSLQTGTRLRQRGTTWDVEPAGRLGGQWGLSQDDYGRLFFGYNQDHLRGSLVPIHYAVRNPSYAARGGVDVRIATDQEVWPHGLTASVNRRAQLRDDGRLRVFTANSGPSVYRAAHFPPEFHGNVFVAEAAGRLIRRVVLNEDRGILTGRSAYAGREFLFSRDERFRPVFTATGPEGALYLVDMYRGVIEGHTFVTTFLRHQVVDRALHQPFEGMGRIYRIVHTERPSGATPAPAPRDAAEWLPFLHHSDGFWRDAAQRALVAAGDVSVVPRLRELAASAPDARTRLHAVWTLDGLGLVDERTVQERLRDPSPHVRSAALRLSEGFLRSADMLRALLRLAGDPDVTVRRQLVFSLGAFDLPAADDAVLSLLQRDAGEPFTIDAALSGFEGREAAVLDRVLDEGDWPAERAASRELVAALATAVTNEGVPDRVDRMLRRIADERQPVWRRLALLEGIDAAERKHLRSPPPALALLRAVDHPELREKALTVVGTFAMAAGHPKHPEGASTAAADPAVERARAAYAICAACHQPDGRGLEALAPSLHATPRVTGAPDALIDIVLHGRDEDPAFPSMPPLTALNDEQIAAILTYIRQAWGNGAAPVSADQVRRRREHRD